MFSDTLSRVVAVLIGAAALAVGQWVWKRFLSPHVQRLAWTGVHVEGNWIYAFDSVDGKKNYDSTIKLVQTGGQVYGDMALKVRFKKAPKAPERTFDVRLEGIVRGSAVVLQSVSSRADSDLNSNAVLMCFLLTVSPDNTTMTGMQAWNSATADVIKVNDKAVLTRRR